MTAHEYVRRVDRALGDLPWGERRDLVAELRGHLAELPPGTNFGERLGAPERYAADLRAAAGLGHPHGVIAYLRARRPRNLILTVVIVTAIVLAIGSVDWIRSYQPLAFPASEGSYGFPPHTVIAPAGNSASVVFRKGRPFHLDMLVENTGRFAVRVLGVPTAGEPFKARVWMVGPWKDGAPSPSGGFKRFHPFDFEPGTRVDLALRGVYANCSAFHVFSGGRPVGGASFIYFPVRYSFLWRTSIALIPFPTELVFTLPNKNSSCD